MADSPRDLSLDRTTSVFGADEGYRLHFGLPARPGEATTSELQTLCRGSILVGYTAARMGWDWPTTIRQVDHLSAPLGEFLLIEVKSRVFRSARFRRALHEGACVAGLDPYKVKVMDTENANLYLLGHGLPPV